MFILSILLICFSLFSLYAYSYIRLVGLFWLISILYVTFSLFIFFNKFIIWYQMFICFYNFSFLNINYIIGFDGLSILLIFLSSFLVLFCLLIYWYLRYKINFYIFLLFLCVYFFINVFLTYDFIFFYIFFEAIVIPMYLLIGIWGSRVRKIYAAYQFFFYTLFGSVLMLIAFLDLYLNSGSSSFFVFNLQTILYNDRYFFIWLLLFLGLSVKIPILPFHIWLPEAHVEAPTPGSVLLAGILLKLGSYAMLRFLILGNFFLFSLKWVFFVLIIAFIGFVYSSLVALNQIDIKKTIAYASIAHMNFSLIGLFSQSILGVSGACAMMIGHGLTSSALFIAIGMLYDRYKTRLIFYYGSIASIMPIFSFFFFIFILSNLGFPGTVNFFSEFLISTGVFFISNTIMIFVNIGLILSAFYSLFLYNRLFFGPFKLSFIRYFCDCTRLEFFILLIFFFCIIIFGIFPNIIMQNISLNLLSIYIYSV